MWTVGQRTLIGGLNKAYFVAEIHPRTQDILVVSINPPPAAILIRSLISSVQNSSEKLTIVEKSYQPNLKFISLGRLGGQLFRTL